MVTICPTITADNLTDYSQAINNLKHFSQRIHVDLMDGEFAPISSIPIKEVWWPSKMTIDIHLMYQRPMECLEELIKLHPHMVIIHNEVNVHHMHFAAELHKAGISSGLAILQDTPVEYAYQIMHSFDQILIFSGKLGHQGGEADLGLLDKVFKIRQHHPDAEIAWDGGINEHNASTLVDNGVDILDVGSFIHNSDNPQKAYDTLDILFKKN